MRKGRSKRGGRYSRRRSRGSSRSPPTLAAWPPRGSAAMLRQTRAVRPMKINRYFCLYYINRLHTGKK